MLIIAASPQGVYKCVSVFDTYMMSEELCQIVERTDKIELHSMNIFVKILRRIFLMVKSKLSYSL